MFTFSGLLLFHNIQSKCSKNNVKEGTECEVVELYHAYEINDDTDFEIETVDNFPRPFNKFIIFHKILFKMLFIILC